MKRSYSKRELFLFNIYVNWDPPTVNPAPPPENSAPPTVNSAPPTVNVYSRRSKFSVGRRIMHQKILSLSAYYTIYTQRKILKKIAISI